MTGKRFCLLMMLTVVSGFFGGAVSNLLLHGTPVAAQEIGEVQDVVTARSFDVVDDEGNVRVRLGLSTDGSQGLWLYGADQQQRAVLGTMDDGSPGLWMYDATGNTRCLLSLMDDGGPDLSLYDGSQNVRARFGVSDDGPGLSLSDDEGHIRAGLVALPEGTILGIRDAAGETRLMLMVQEDGRAGVALFDAAGKPMWQVP